MPAPRNHADFLARAAERRRAVKEHYDLTGSLTLTGVKFGITKQRVEQIVKGINRGPKRKKD